MDPNKENLPRESIHSYRMDDALVLFDACTRQIYRINGTAMAIWQGICAGIPPDDIASHLSAQSGEALPRVLKDVNDMVEQWRCLGFFDFPAQEAIENESEEIQSADGNLYDVDIPSMPGEFGYNFQMVDTRFRLTMPDSATHELITPMLQHLSYESDKGHDMDIAVVKNQDRYVALINGLPVDACRKLDGVTPMVFASAVFAAYDQSQHLMGLHAAAVAFQGRSVLMPGLPASGKSTLTAALVGSGCSFLADDMVLCTSKNMSMRSVPTAIGLKSGSWAPLRGYFPSIEALPVHLRADNQSIRYFVPPVDAIGWDSLTFNVDILVFPHFMAGREVDLASISAADGLSLLTAAGYDVPGELNPDVVQNLIDWITNVPCYEMYFSHLDDAVSVIKELLS